MDETTTQPKSGHTWRWYAGWLLAILVGVGGMVGYGIHQADAKEEARNADTPPPPKKEKSFTIKIANPDGTFRTETKVMSAKPPPPNTPAMDATKSLPPTDKADAEKEYTKVKLHYGTDRAQVSSVWSLVKRDFKLVGILGIIALLVTLLYKHMVSPALRKIRWVVYALVWGAFLYGLPSAIQGSWITYKRHKDLGTWYGKARNPDGGFEMGTCTVTIPEKRETGTVTHASIWNGEWSPDPSKHFTMSSLTPQKEDEFFDDLSAHLKQKGAEPGGQESVLVFVHGYNNRFEHAAFRVAQIVHDLKYPGVPIFWSWPSQGEEESYLIDKTEAERSVSRLADFLRLIKKRSGTKRVQLLAHSMGSWVLTRAVKSLEIEAGSNEKLFELIVLGAPDIDADVFKKEIAPKLAERAGLLTIYASRNDPALKISEVANGYPRIGDVNPEPAFVPNIDTIDVSSICSGHTYIGNNGRVLADLRLLLTDAEPAETRMSKSNALSPFQLNDTDKVWQLMHIH